MIFGEQLKNKKKYARFRKLRDQAIREARKHASDEDDSEFRYYATIAIQLTQECLQIPLH